MPRCKSETRSSYQMHYIVRRVKRNTQEVKKKMKAKKKNPKRKSLTRKNPKVPVRAENVSRYKCCIFAFALEKLADVYILSRATYHRAPRYGDVRT